MSIGFPEVIQQAQQSLDDGDYQETVTICSTIINQYPACEVAYRLLGEALLEQGQVPEAERAYGRALSHDPRQPASYLGLGRIAEGRSNIEHALAYCQVAWELAPNIPDYREPVVQIASHQFGGDGHLQLTHAALAQMHLHNSRMQRAVREFQIALAALPDRADLWIGLAESHWRLGQDSDAAEIAREFLKKHPGLVQALVILVDIEHRQGNTDEADQLLDRLRRIDPAGVAVQTMTSRNSLAATDFLLNHEADMSVVEARLDAVPEERSHIRLVPTPDAGHESPDKVEPVLEMEDRQPADSDDFSDEAGIVAGVDVRDATALSREEEEGDNQLSMEEPAVESLTQVSSVEVNDLFAEYEEAYAGEGAGIPVSDNADDLESGNADELAELAEQFDDINLGGLAEFEADVEAAPAESTTENVAEPEIMSETGTIRHQDTPRAALQETSGDDEMHWHLAEALRERGDVGESMLEYRWLIRHAPNCHDIVIQALNACIEEGQEVEMSHRLLADIYRRNGNRARASSHAQLAITTRHSNR